MVADAAHRERDIGSQLFPRAQRARVTRRLLLRFDAAELDARGTLGGVACQAAPLEIVCAVEDMAPVLLVHLALQRGAIEEVTQDRASAVHEYSHNVPGVARSAAVMPATTCSQ